MTRTRFPGEARDRWQHVLVVEADDRHATTVRSMLLAGGYESVTVATELPSVCDLVRSGRVDIALVARHLPGRDGFEVLRAIHEVDGRFPVVMVTEGAEVDDVVAALRLRAADVLLRPFTREELVERIDTILAERAKRRGREVAVAVGSHPDDVEIGAGGALLAHRARGDRVVLLVMSGGERGGNSRHRHAEAHAAADALGAELVLGDLDDTRIAPHGRSVELVEEVVGRFGATRVYTHSAHDRHQDHRNTHQAVMVAARTVPRVFGFQSPSSTVDFRPTRFESIDSYLEDKLALIGWHRSQVAAREYLDDELITATARYWGRFGVSRYAEAFEVLRDAQQGWNTEPERRSWADEETHALLIEGGRAHGLL